MVVQDAVELCPDFARRTGRARWPGRIDPQVLEYVDHAAEDYRSRKGDLPVWRGPVVDQLLAGQARGRDAPLRVAGARRFSTGSWAPVLSRWLRSR
jgi:hypothetical protein